MKLFSKMTTVLVSLALGWCILFWMQWSNEMTIASGLVATPLLMLVMAFMAVMAMHSDGEV